MTPSDFFNSLLNKKSKTNKKDNVLNAIYTTPQKDKRLETPTFEYIAPNIINQIDLISLPNDKGFDKALVVVDQGSRLTDAEPLDNKSSDSAFEALKRIYERGILKQPKLIQSDSGKEFMGEFEQNVKSLGIMTKFGKPDRHRSQALVERKNYTIGSIIWKMLNNNYLGNRKASSQWVKVLPDLITAINEQISKRKKPKFIDEPVGKIVQSVKFIDKQTNPKKKPQKIKVVETSYITDLLNVGDKVRVQLDAPIDIDGKKIMGKFRQSDIRFNPDIKTIKFVLMKPNQPVMYMLNDDKYNIAYTRNQLLKVNPNEKEITLIDLPTDDDDQHKRLEVYKIMDKKTENRRVYYLVKWKKVKEPTWELRTSLIEDVPQLIKRFDKSIEKAKQLVKKTKKRKRKA